MSKKKDYLRYNRLDYSHFFTSDEESPDDSLSPEAKFPLGRRKRIFDFVPERPKVRKSIIDRAFPKAPEGADVDAAAAAAPTSKARKRIFQMPEQRQTARKPIIDRNFNDLVCSTPLGSGQKTFNKSVPLSPIALEHPRHAHVLKTPVLSSLPPDTEEKVKPSSRSIRVQTDFPYAVAADDAPVGHAKGERVGECPQQSGQVNRAHSVRTDESSEENTLVEMMLAKAEEIMERHNNNEEDDSDESSSKISWLSALLREHNLEMNSGSSDTSSVPAKVIQKNRDVQDHHHAPKISNNIISRGHDRNEGSRQVKKSAHPADRNRMITSPAKVLFPVGGREASSQSTRHPTKNKTCRKGTSVGKSIVNKQISSIRDSPCGDYDSHDTYYTKSVTEKASRVNSLCEELLRRRLSSTSKVSNELDGLNERSESPVKIPEVDGMCVPNAGSSPVERDRNDSKSRRRESRRTISRTSTDRAVENAPEKDRSKEVFLETSTNRTVENILKNNKSRKRDSEEISIDKVVQNTSKSKNKRKSDAKYLASFEDEPIESSSEEDEGDEQENDEFLSGISIDKAVEITSKNKKNNNSRNRGNGEILAETSTNRMVENTSKNNKSRKRENEQISTDKLVQNVSKNRKNKSRERGNDDAYLERFVDEPGKSISKNNVDREQENEDFLLGMYIDKAVETTSKNKKNNNSRNRGNGEILAETSTNRMVENASKNNKSRQHDNEEISTDKVVQNTSNNKKNKSKERGDDDIYLERFADEPEKSTSKDHESSEEENEDFSRISIHKAVETTSKNKENRGNTEIFPETSTNRSIKNTSKNGKSRREENIETFLEILGDNAVKSTKSKKKNNNSKKGGNKQVLQATSIDKSVKHTSKKDKSTERREREETVPEICTYGAIDNNTSKSKENNYRGKRWNNKEISPETFTDGLVENTSKHDKSRRRENDISYSEDRSIEDDVSPLLNKDKSQYKCRKKKLKGDDTSTSGRDVPNRSATSCSRDRDKSIEKSGQGEKNKKIVILSNNLLDDTPDMRLDTFLPSRVPDPAANDDPPNERSRRSTRKVKTSTITDKKNPPNGVIKKRGQPKLVPDIIEEENDNGPRRSKRQPKPRVYAYIPAVVLTHDARLLKGNSCSQSTILAGAKWLNLNDTKKMNSLSTTNSRSTRTKTIKRDTKKESTVSPTSEAVSREHEMAEAVPSTSHATNLPSSIAEESPPGDEDGTVQQQTDEEGPTSLASWRSDYKKRPYMYFPKNNKLRRIDWYLWPDIEWTPIGNGEDMRIGRGCKSAQAGFQNGYLEILPGRTKPKEMTSSCTVTFFVLEGECWFQVQDSYEFARKYSNWQVPLGAFYSIINASKSERLLLAYTKVQGANHSN